MKSTKILVAGLFLSTAFIGGTKAFAQSPVPVTPGGTTTTADPAATPVAPAPSFTSHATIQFHENNTPTEPKDPTNPVNPVDPTKIQPEQKTNNNGPLSLDVVPLYSFGDNAVLMEAHNYPDTNSDPLKNYLQVTDNRVDLNGWTLTVKKTNFKSTVANEDGNTLEIQNTILNIPAGVVRNNVASTKQGNDGGTENPVTATEISSPAIALANQDDTTILFAKDETAVGKGTTTSYLGEKIDDQGVSTMDATTLTVPAGEAKIGNFSAELTWTLVAGVGH